MSIKESEVLCLSIQDLNKMKQDYHDAYDKLLNDAYIILRRSLTLKLKAMNHCAERDEEMQGSTTNGPVQ